MIKFDILYDVTFILPKTHFWSRVIKCQIRVESVENVGNLRKEFPFDQIYIGLQKIFTYRTFAA